MNVSTLSIFVLRTLFLPIVEVLIGSTHTLCNYRQQGIEQVSF
jgi:hypothetical protein